MSWAICNASRPNSALGPSRSDSRLVVAMLAIRVWRALKEHVFAPYHPERHYMRGPGPKWRKKHERRLSHGV